MRKVIYIVSIFLAARPFTCIHPTNLRMPAIELLSSGVWININGFIFHKRFDRRYFWYFYVTPQQVEALNYTPK